MSKKSKPLLKTWKQSGTRFLEIEGIRAGEMGGEEPFAFINAASFDLTPKILKEMRDFLDRIAVEVYGEKEESPWNDLRICQPRHGDPVILWTRQGGVLPARYIDNKVTVPHFIVGAITVWPEEEKWPVLWQPMPKAPTNAEVDALIEAHRSEKVS